MADLFGGNNRWLTTARLAGMLYLVVIVCAGFAEVVRSSMIESGDAAATAQNIRDSEWLFRVGFASDVVAFSADVALGLALYLLLRPVNAGLALLAAFFRLAQAAVLGINLLNQFIVLLLISGESYLTAFAPDQLDALVLLFLDAHAYGYLIGLVFFALSSLALGYLVFKSDYLPRALGAGLMVFVTVGYLGDSFSRFFGADEAMLSTVLIAPAALVEIVFCLWLVVKGGSVKEEAPRHELAATASA